MGGSEERVGWEEGEMSVEVRMDVISVRRRIVSFC